MNRVLVVDDEPAMCAALEASFSHNGWKVETASGTREAVERFRLRPCPLVITDMRMPDGDGLKVMSGIRTLAPETAVIFLTAYGNMSGGSRGYERWRLRLSRQADFVRPTARGGSAGSLDGLWPQPRDGDRGIIRDSVPMRRLMDRARRKMPKPKLTCYSKPRAERAKSFSPA